MGKKVREWLREICTEVWREEGWPEDWRGSSGAGAKERGREGRRL